MYVRQSTLLHENDFHNGTKRFKIVIKAVERQFDNFFHLLVITCGSEIVPIDIAQQCHVSSRILKRDQSTSHEYGLKEGLSLLHDGVVLFIALRVIPFLDPVVYKRYALLSWAVWSPFQSYLKTVISLQVLIYKARNVLTISICAQHH